MEFSGESFSEAGLMGEFSGESFSEAGLMGSLVERALVRLD